MNDEKRTNQELLDEISFLRRRIKELDQSHFYERILNNIQDGVWVTGVDHRIIYANQGIARISGLSAERIVGCSVLTDFPEETLRDFRPHYLRAIESLRPTQYEARVVTPVGRATWQMGWLAPMVEEGIFAGMICTIKDVTERKRAEEALRTGEAQLSNAMKIARLGHWEYNVAEDLFTFNDNFYAMFRTTADRIGGYTMSAAHYAQRFVHPEDISVVSVEIRKALETTDPHYSSQLEHRIIYDDGEIGYIVVRIFVVKDDQGRTVRTYGVNQDISERKRMEEALLQSKVYLQATLEATADGILAVDNAGKTVKANQRFADLWRIPESVMNTGDDDAMLKFVLDQLVDPNAFITKVKSLYGSLQVDMDTLFFKDGRVFDRYSAPLMREGSLIGRVWSFSDVTEKKQVIEALQKSEERYRLLTETLPNSVTVADVSGNVLMTNRRALDIYGHREAAEVLGHNILEWVPPEEREKVSDAFAHVLGGNAVTDFEIRLMKANGELFWASTNASLVHDLEGSPQFVIIVTTDMTERKRAEAELLRTQKLDSLALLAGGIAHDFNNLLQGVFGYMSLAKISLDNREKALAKLEQAEKALTMSVNLTTQLLTFSKGGKPVKKKIALRPVIEDSVKFALSGSRSDCRITVDKAIRHVDADEGQIGQLIQNIVMNANEAMPDGGTIEISAGNVDIAKGGNTSLPDGGKFVKIAIKDSGMGIPEQYLSRIFDPYFTTKQKGSGLGLATSYSIVKNHGGVIEVTSELNKGSTFFIFLPAGESENEEEGRAPSSAGGRKGRILVMDDEEMVRSVAMEMINALGHEVECAKDGEAAIGKFRQARESGRPFDVIILDLTVKGGMGGEQAVIKLQEIDPDIKAVVSSGYADNPVLSEYRSYGFAAFLNKPYRIDALRESLNALLR